jgi:hypothetical protein
VEWKDPVVVVAGDIDEATEKVYTLIYEKISSDMDQAITVKLGHVGNSDTQNYGEAVGGAWLRVHGTSDKGLVTGKTDLNISGD